MQNKNENQKHWKDKLEDVSSFPYAPASKELAWQKLNSRLGEKKRRKRAIWYRASAACLLPLLGLILFLYTHQPPSFVRVMPVKPTIVKPSIDTEPKQNEITAIAAVHQSEIKKREKQKAKLSPTIVIAEKKKETIIIDSGIINNTATVITQNDSISNLSSIAPVQKKKLKVVHINELDEPYESSPVMAHNTYYPRFLPLQLARESIFPEPVKAINKTGFINLKNKSSN